MIRLTGEIHSSKNSPRIWQNRKTGKPFIVKSSAAKADEPEMLRQLLEQRGEWDRMTAGLEYPIVIGFRFLRASHRVFDFLNVAQGVMDAMQAAEYIPNDDAKHVIPDFSRYYAIDKVNPGVEIYVKEWKG